MAASLIDNSAMVSTYLRRVPLGPMLSRPRGPSSGIGSASEKPNYSVACSHARYYESDDRLVLRLATLAAGSRGMLGLLPARNPADSSPNSEQTLNGPSALPAGLRPRAG
jgi:hypothetical protein